MRFQKRLSLWIWVGLFVGSVGAMPLAPWLLRRHADPPRTLTELTELLSRCTPPLYAVPQVEGNPEAGVWVCERPRPREQLMMLRRLREYADGWQGVVYCERLPTTFEIMQPLLPDLWGEFHMQVGPFLLFGDPPLLQRIRQVILDH
jgi:hypothetical protein